MCAAALADRVGSLRSQAILLKNGIAAGELCARLELSAGRLDGFSVISVIKVIKTSLAKGRVQVKLLRLNLKSQLRHSGRFVAGAMEASCGLRCASG